MITQSLKWSRAGPQSAFLFRDKGWLSPLTAQGKCPLVAVAVEIEECFLQCAKAIIRSNLWMPHEWPGVESLPSAARMFCDQAQMPEFDVPKLQSLLDDA